MKYRIEGSDAKYELQKIVMEMCNNGWEPLGGVSVCAGRHGGLYFAQALWKPETVDMEDL